MKNIPYYDVRNSTLSDIVRKSPSDAVSLIRQSRNTLGRLSYILSGLALPIGDRISANWLKKTNNPYLEEIRNFADILKEKGIYSFNLSYEWGCTSGVFRTDEGIKLMRVLDWPFPGLGAHTIIAHQNSAAGEFYNVTWPAISGIFNALAPGRFAAALNQAPMRRYNTGIIVDWIRNRILFNESSALPPSHLLRKVFEEARNYEEAKKMLTETPVAIPVFYILSGPGKNQGCIIERIENEAVIREIGDNDRVTVANHFESYFNGMGKGWKPRAKESHARAIASCNMNVNAINDDNFDWFVAPIANEETRLVMLADVKNGKMSVCGTEGEKPVTNSFKISV